MAKGLWIHPLLLLKPTTRRNEATFDSGCRQRVATRPLLTLDANNASQRDHF
jgi:hypothetical protein